MRRLTHVLGIVAVLAVVPAPAAAATFTVTRTDDPTPDGCQPADCSLREAIVAANAAGGPDTVTVPGGIYVLAIPPDGTPEDGLDGDLDIGGDLLIQGAGARTTVIDANHVDRAIHVCCNLEVDILGVTISNGRTSSPFGGGGLFASSSDVALTGVAVVANATTDGNGGGLTVSNATSLLSVRDSVIAGNVASETGGADGGGLSNGNQATAVLTNVTVTGNRASQLGGGIEAAGPISLDNVTITGNTATQDAFYSGESRGGGLAQGGPSATIENSIVAANSATDGDPDCHTIGPITSQGHN
ncbi:MAG: CSLREA domain-containing protein, partial [Actinomycetota bacterium]